MVRFANITEMYRAKKWLEDEENFSLAKSHFDSTSRFARLQRIKAIPRGRDLFIQFRATTGDAMGMNMVSKVSLSTSVHSLDANCTHYPW